MPNEGGIKYFLYIKHVENGGSLLYLETICCPAKNIKAA